MYTVISDLFFKPITLLKDFYHNTVGYEILWGLPLGQQTEVVLPGGFQLGLGPKAYPPQSSSVLCLTLTDASGSGLPNL